MLRDRFPVLITMTVHFFVHVELWNLDIFYQVGSLKIENKTTNNDPNFSDR